MYFSLGLKSNGSVVAWGDCAYGQCKVPSPNDWFGAVAAGWQHGLGLVGSFGACCRPDGSCAVRTKTDCQPPNTWQGAGTVCQPNLCPPPTGACCLPDGSCMVTTQAACSGAWEGMDTGCVPNPCPQPTGACCSLAGRCTIETESQCETEGGTWLGPSMSCTPNLCPTSQVEGSSTAWRLGPVPNPSTGRVVIGYRLAAASAVAVEILDSSGRVVRHLADGAHLPGDYSIVWDGRDDSGRPLPAAVYLTCIKTPAGATAGKVVLTRR